MSTKMKRNIFFSTLLIFLATVSVLSSKSKYGTNNPECTEKFLKKTSLAVAKLMTFGPNGRKFPETEGQLAPYCCETANLVGQINQYFSKCLKKEIRDISNVLLYSIKSNIRTFCKKKNKKLTKLLETTPCINKFIHDETCLMKYINSTKQLIPLKIDDLTKIRHACCYYVVAIRCSNDWLEKRTCIRDRKELLLDFVRGIFGSFVDFMCGDYNESSDRCDLLAPPPKPKVANRKQYDTFLFLLLDLLESTKNFELIKT